MCLLGAWLRGMSFWSTSIDRPLRLRRGRLGGLWFSRGRGPRRKARPQSCRAARRAFECLEPLALLSADAWTGAAGDGLWSTPGNWSAGVPTAASDASISGATVSLPAGGYQVASLNLAAGAAIDFTLAGTQAGSDYAVLDVQGAATLAGTIGVTAAGFTPGPDDTYQPLIFGSESGTPTSTVPAGEASSLTPTGLYVLPAGFGTLTVTNTANTGAGSLHDAITAADGSANPVELIDFNIPTTDLGYDGVKHVWTISPTSALPLPAVTKHAVIDATTQPGYAGKPVIQLTGGSAGSSADGLDFSGGNSRASGLAVNGFGGDAIYLSGAGHDTLTADFLGTDPTGGNALANGGNGVGIGTGAGSNTVGGIVPGAVNVISGNSGGGIYVFNGTSGNLIEGNFIGTNAGGTAALGNAENGVEITGGATNNTIGGTASGARNVISGNAYGGVLIRGSGVSGNNVLGNFIGTDAAGSAALGNSENAVDIDTGATNNTIGGTAPGAGNVISGNGGANGYDGVYVSDSGTLGNMVLGNFIGTNAAGTAALGNTGNGVTIAGGATNNTIGGTTGGAGNVVSGNAGDGVHIRDAGTSGNVVEGNFIGTNAAGTAALGNGANGADISDAATNNVVGGTTAGARNIISGNGDAAGKIYGGVNIGGGTAGTANNIVEGNFIGTNFAGTAALPNVNYGVDIYQSATGNTIGGTAAGAGNLISGNSGYGVEIDPQNTGNTVAGNTIGADVTGKLALPNTTDGVAVFGSNNTIGGSASAANTIAFNQNDGVLVDTGTENLISQNSIFSSGHLGIELTNNGNNNQPAPVLTSLSVGSGGASVTGSLTAAANTTYLLEFFANAGASPSGFGEGQTFLGSQSVTTDAGGTAGFTASLPALPAGQQLLAATATDPGHNTSQFSNDVTLAPVLPTSSVAALPATENSTGFTVSWSGSDVGGPGIASFSVYVSDNGGPFTAFQTNTTGTSATFTGVNGHTYGFYSVATDTAGNVQATPTAAQATTTISVPTTGSIAATAVPVTGYEFSPPTSVPVATFSDGDGSLPASDFSATIDWGDGTTSAGSVAVATGSTGGPSTAQYTVTGSHEYLDEGRYTVSVSIAQTAGPTSSGATSATVSAAATIHEALLANGAVGTPDQNYIQEIYRDLFGRLAEPSGLAFWVARLEGGESRFQLAYDMVKLATPEEFQIKTVAKLYEQYLGRAPDLQGQQAWAAYLFDGGTVESMSELLVGSSEYYHAHGGGSNQGFLQALFQDAFGRPIDPAALTYFTGLIAGGASTYDIAGMIFNSDEYHRARVNDIFEQILDRPAETAAQAAFALELDNGGTDELVISQLISSDEYFAKAQV